MNLPTIKGYVTFAAFEAAEILPIIGKGMPALSVLSRFDMVEMPVDSNRLECFKRSPICVMCGRVGTVFLLQTFRKGARIVPHLNLYYVGPSGHYHLMTQDHILP